MQQGPLQQRPSRPKPQVRPNRPLGQNDQVSRPSQSSKPGVKVIEDWEYIPPPGVGKSNFLLGRHHLYILIKCF